MGVFARLLRRSKAAEEASTAEAETGAVTAGTDAETPDEAKGSHGTESEAATEESSEATASDGVDIPKQQSADEAADSEAGDGARK
ncbi:hypothetical protein ACIPJS_12020 [Streptomyces sp. NPDC086783]|uniref:hypothetical protein n=1 Tax=Streptomyces sp. NPDC086783 TaxID=3365758 RepID=UPI00381C7B3D